MTKTLLVTAAAWAFVSVSAQAQMSASTAQMSAPTTSNSDPAPTQAMPYVAKAGASDLYEIQSSQIALDKAKNGKVKSFARMMIQHHTMTTKETVAAAKKAGMSPPPPALEAQQAEMISQLQPLSGDAFDQAYVSQQKMAHTMALTLHQTYASQGDTPQLKKTAAKAVPIVQRHINQLKGM